MLEFNLDEVMNSQPSSNYANRRWLERRECVDNNYVKDACHLTTIILYLSLEKIVQKKFRHAFKVQDREAATCALQAGTQAIRGRTVHHLLATSRGDRCTYSQPASRKWPTASQQCGERCGTDAKEGWSFLAHPRTAASSRRSCSKPFGGESCQKQGEVQCQPQKLLGRRQVFALFKEEESKGVFPKCRRNFTAGI